MSRAMDEMWEQARQEGKAEGMDIKAIDVAKKMLKAGILTLKQLEEMTDLSTAKVRSLKAQM